MDVVEKDPLFYRIVRPLIVFLFKVLYRPTIIGKENIPKNGGIVLAGGSHTNNFDCISLIVSTKRCVHFLAKDELYKGIKKILFKNMGIIPVNRRKKDGFALNKAISFLKKDMVIGVFPEGTFNKTEEPTIPFKIGAIKMAHDTKSKIVPFIIKGEYKIFKKGLIIEFFPPFTVKSDDLDKENEKFRNFINKKLKKSEV